MAAVVAQLLEVRERLAATAVIAMRAKADAEHSHGQYTEAAKGTNNSRIQRAKADIEIAAAKSARVARLLNRTRDHVTRYLNKIAPGAVPSEDPSIESMPSGEQLLADSESRANAKSSAASFLRRAVKNVESAQDSTKTITELGETGVKILRNPSGPKGTQSVGTEAPTTPTLAPRPKIDVPETVGHFVVLGILSAVAIQKTEAALRKSIARRRNRERSDRTD